MNIKFKYVEHYLPPRCRKYRSREVEVDVNINIPVVPAEDAPVVCTVKNGFDLPLTPQNCATANRSRLMCTMSATTTGSSIGGKSAGIFTPAQKGLPKLKIFSSTFRQRCTLSTATEILLSR